MLCLKHNVPVYMPDIEQPLHQALSVASMRDYPEPILYVPQHRNKGKGKTQAESSAQEREAFMLGST